MTGSSNALVCLKSEMICGELREASPYLKCYQTNHGEEDMHVFLLEHFLAWQGPIREVTSIALPCQIRHLMGYSKMIRRK